MHLPLFAEAHFLLGGMHVHVNLLRRHFQKQDVGRGAAPGPNPRFEDERLVGCLDAVPEGFVVDEPSVDEGVLHIDQFIAAVFQPKDIS